MLSAARPLVDLLWARETEAGPLDTPERRAALEQRLRQALAAIRDETLRRYYRDEVEARLAAIREAERRPFRRDFGGGDRAGNRGQWSSAGERHQAGRPAALRASPLLAKSALFLGGSASSSREAFILSVLSAHPELLHEHAETLSELDLAGRDAKAVRGVLLDCAAGGEGGDPAILEARLARAGLGEAAAELAVRVGSGDRWALDPHADPLRLADALRQAFILHRRARTLHSELRAAERALAEEESEANLAWLREVQNQLSSVAGAEADAEEIVGRAGAAAFELRIPTGGASIRPRGCAKRPIGGMVYSKSTRLTVGSVEALTGWPGRQSLAAFSASRGGGKGRRRNIETGGMATKATEREDTEGDTEALPKSDGPLLDLTDAAVKRMIKLAKKRGYVTYDELNEVLPSEEFTSEQIEDVLGQLSEMGINVVEAEEAEEGRTSAPPRAMPAATTTRAKAARSSSRPRRGRSRSARPRRRSRPTAPTIRCACTCARWARSSCSRARARSRSRSASRPAARR